MSHSEHTQRCISMLEQQVHELGNLRNAQSRDPAFRAWRLATMTVLQRIWANDATRVEGFRRIAFTAPGPKPEKEFVRECFARGCDQAEAYLLEQLVWLERDGAPDSREPALADSTPQTHGPEDDYPVIELGPSVTNARAKANVDHDDGHAMGDTLDLGGSSSVPAARESARPDDAPAPPTLKIEVPPALRVTKQDEEAAAAHAPQVPTLKAAPVKAETPVAPAAPVMPPVAPPVAEAPKPAAPAPAPAPAPKPAAKSAAKPSRRERVKSRLKDMLGLGQLEAAAKPVREPEPVRASEPVPAPAPEPVPAPVPVPPPVAAAPATPAAPVTPPPATPEPVAPASPSGVFATAPRPLKGKPRRVESMESLVPESLRTPHAPEPEAAPTPIANTAPAEPALDAEEFERATEELFKSSPVLGLVGKPVQRMSDTTSFSEPDAIALASLAPDVAKLGVGEGSRASARAMLLDLATHIDAGTLDWATLRDGIAIAMEHPELARRVVPILLPWLERAAA